MSETSVEQAHAFLRAHTTLDLRFDEHLRELRYTIDRDGRLVAPVMVAMLTSADTVAFVPGYEEGAMEMMVTLEQFEETGTNGAVADRWRIYHGDPPDVRWARFDVDAARFQTQVIDGDALMQPNPLADDEPALCRLINSEHRDGLKAACTAASLDVEDPLVVGVDPWGLDVRRRFDVVRLAFAEQPQDAAGAKDCIRAMLGG